MVLAVHVGQMVEDPNVYEIASFEAHELAGRLLVLPPPHRQGETDDKDDDFMENHTEEMLNQSN